jgi:hypothetical protein
MSINRAHFETIEFTVTDHAGENFFQRHRTIRGNFFKQITTQQVNAGINPTRALSTAFL